MTREDNADRQGRRPHAKVLAAPFLEFDLDRELELLDREPEWSGGQNARTLAKYPDLRVVLIALEEGAQIAEHRAPGPISIQTLRGHLRVRALRRTFTLSPGGLLTLEGGALHEVEATEASAFLLTVSSRPGRAGAGGAGKGKKPPSPEAEGD